MIIFISSHRILSPHSSLTRNIRTKGILKLYLPGFVFILLLLHTLFLLFPFFLNYENFFKLASSKLSIRTKLNSSLYGKKNFFLQKKQGASSFILLWKNLMNLRKTQLPFLFPIFLFNLAPHYLFALSFF